jgi:tetratricopeptide (TPR) repeat protein
MVLVTRVLLIITLMISFSGPGFAAQKKSGGPQEMLPQFVEELKKNPADHALREKIIKLAMTMKPTPAVPEDAERGLVRGAAHFQKATDINGYKKAISEFEAAVNAAPWLAIAYYNLGVAQEKAAYYPEAIRNLKFYLLAAPDAKNARDVKNKIYALEVDIEDLQAGKNTPAPPAQPAPPADSGAGKALGIPGKPSLDIEPSEKQLSIIKMPPPEKKSKMPSFFGTWYFKDVLRGEELTIEAFEISKNASGDLVLTPPKRAADSYASVTQFEINDRNLKLQLRWKMKSVVGYWKTETYDLSLSEDGKTLTGSHNQKSVGGRTIEMDRVLFRQ